MVLDAARASIATALGVRPVDVYFTSSGPTAIRIAVDGLLRARAGASAGAVVGAVESLAVLEPVHALADEVMVIPVDGVGRVDLDAFAEALARPAALACLQAANAEVGTRQPLARVARLARDHDVPLLVHAIRSSAATRCRDWDAGSVGSRLGRPSGVGVLAVPSVRWRPDQSPDRGWVGGFPDIAAAAAAATALGTSPRWRLPSQLGSSAWSTHPAPTAHPGLRHRSRRRPGRSPPAHRHLHLRGRGRRGARR
jgi:cysteine desulfurase